MVSISRSYRKSLVENSLKEDGLQLLWFDRPKAVSIITIEYPVSYGDASLEVNGT